MNKTEQAPLQVDALSERSKSREKLRQQELKDVAAVAFLAVLIAAYSGRESDHLFTAPETQKQKGTEPDYAATHAEVLGLLNSLFSARGTETTASSDSQPKAKRPSSLGGDAAQPGSFKNFYTDYRNSFLGPRPPAATPVTQPTAPDSGFKPAPNMASTELGPQLPNLAFNDRVRPVGAEPTAADFAAAERANQMYQTELFNKGWRGGEATPEQAKKAGKSVNFTYSADRNPDAPALDQEAIKAFNANRAKPTTSDEGTFAAKN